MSCSPVVAALSCGGSHTVTALGCCDHTPETVTPFVVAPVPVFISDLGPFGRMNFNSVVVVFKQPSPTPGEVGVPDEAVITKYEVLGFPSFTAGQFVGAMKRNGDIIITGGGGGIDTSIPNGRGSILTSE